MKKLLLCALLALTAGCTPSKNIILASARAGSIVGTAALLDLPKDEATYTTAKESTVVAATAIKNFLSSGSIGDLPISSLNILVTNKLIEAGHPEATPFVSQVLNIAGTQKVELRAVNDYSKVVIIQALDDIISECAVHKFEWRPQAPTAPATQAAP